MIPLVVLSTNNEASEGSVKMRGFRTYGTKPQPRALLYRFVNKSTEGIIGRPAH